MKIVSIVGARPNFMKIAPFSKIILEYNKNNPSRKLEHILIHTGQHYDDKMSKSFFEELNIPEADINLGIGSGSHAQQVGTTMIEFEKIIQNIRPDWVVVVGDVNATLACSITAKKEGVKCCHIEAGLRSGDMNMPEEINRLVTDRLSDLLLTPDEISSNNLLKEGVNSSKIVFVGNIMIDTLDQNIDKAHAIDLNDIIKTNCLSEISSKHIEDGKFCVITLHRPSNVDQKEVITDLINFIIEKVSSELKIIWPIHPRTLKNLEKFDLLNSLTNNENIILTSPLGYHEMLRLNLGAKLFLTDSGGLQEECTVVGTPCLTLRWNTERPITLKENGGASILVGNNIDRITEEYNKTKLTPRNPFRPALWDGKTAARTLDAILKFNNE
jgi:UDP-N-acetylglucosamine 2-epimerase (non-hydrolysing)